MEEEIDLRPFIEALLKNWKWIIISSIVAAIATFIIVPAASVTYSATAIVAVLGPGDTVELDRTIAAVAEYQPLAAFPELAKNNDVLSNVLPQLSDPSITLSNLSSHLSAVAGADKTLIRLTASSQDPELAAEMANSWATSFVEWANLLYAGQGNDRLTFFEAQLASTEQSLTVAESALETYQAINQTKIISNTLGIFQNNHANYLSLQEDTHQLLDNAHALRAQIANNPSQENSYADQLTYLQLQLQTFNDESALPIILEINTQDVLTTMNRDDQIDTLDALITTLELKSETIQARVAEIETEILQLQQEGQSSFTELARLRRDYNIVEKTYMSIAFQVEEERIISQDSSNGFRVASGALTSRNPEGRGRIFSTLIAAAIGAFLAIIAISGAYWWNSQESASENS